MPIFFLKKNNKNVWTLIFLIKLDNNDDYYLEKVGRETIVYGTRCWIPALIEEKSM